LSRHRWDRTISTRYHQLRQYVCHLLRFEGLVKAVEDQGRIAGLTSVEPA
jgi:hypothetical protein